MKSTLKLPELWLGIGATVIAVFAWQYRLRFPFDDTFISFRYAEHLANGNGLVWNIGGPHTEGYTNFLFVVFLAAASFISHDLLAMAQIIGLLSTLATGLLLYLIAKSWRDNMTGILAGLLYFITPLTWINALSGMETSFFVFLIVLSIALFRTRARIAFFVVLLATLTRPEAGLPAVIAFAVLLFTISSKKAVAIAFLLSFVIPMLVSAIWEYEYFDYLLPNSFYVKVLSATHSLFPGLQYVRLFLVSTIILIVASLGIRKWSNIPAFTITLFWTLILIIFYIFVLPLEGLYDRFLWPAFAMLCLTAAVGLRDFTSRFGQKVFFPAATLLLVAHILLMSYSPRTRQSLIAHEELWDANMDHLVHELKLLPHFDSLTLAYGDAGYIIYKSGIKHLDLFGLNNTPIAHARGNSLECATIVSSENPDIILLPAKPEDSCYRLVEDAYGIARTNLYTPAASFDAFPYRLVLYIGIRSPFANDLNASIGRELHTSVSFLQPAPRCLK